MNDERNKTRGTGPDADTETVLDRRTFLRIAVGARGAGRVAVAALPLMRLAKRWLRARRETGGANEVRTHTSIPGGSRSPN